MSHAVRAEAGLLNLGSTTIPLVAGEIQFWRMDPETWGPAIRAARDAGVTVISTYLSWRRHEVAPGQVDFEGRNDKRLNLRAFLDLCVELDVYVQLKPGPWICAEEPGGGYPDWLLARNEILARDDQGHTVIGYNPPFLHPVPSYSNDDYLTAVASWFDRVWEAIAGYVYPHGPIIALQLDNEPSSCFQDSMYGADYSESSISAFRDWLRGRYGDDPSRLATAWAARDLEFSDAQPPRRPEPSQAVPRQKLYDWIEYKTYATGVYLARLKCEHHARGGTELLYTVNLITHPIHDVPVAHHAIREATGAATGEDHYYIPPLDGSDIHRLARSAATARAAGEPLPWVPELQAGIWRSPGEDVTYPDPTPLEQEIWSGAAIALGFAGANFYMLADRENWEHAPLTVSGQPSPFFVQVRRIVDALAERHDLLSVPPRPSVIVAWHRPDAYDAYAVTGTARDLDVDWKDGSDRAYRAWDDTLEKLTQHGISFDLWDTSTELVTDPTIPLLITPGSGAGDAVGKARVHGRTVIEADAEFDSVIDAIADRTPHVVGREGRVPRTIVSIHLSSADAVVHVVHWGEGEANASLALPGTGDGVLRKLDTGDEYSIINGRVPLDLAPGHHIFVIE
jgi:hypothetical protein